jgi:uncharacterized protein
MIQRQRAKELIELVAEMPCVAIVGPRQVGKTTLVKNIDWNNNRKIIYLDLESNQDKNRLQDAELYLSERQYDTIIIDEIQRMPELFPLLRSLIDRHRVAGRFVLLGSASPDLLQRSSESLAGRISYLELHTLHWGEVGSTVSYQQHWLRGGFPNMLLANTDRAFTRRMNDFIVTYIERELPLLGLSVTPNVIRNLFTMLIGVHGNLLNVSDLSRSLGLSVTTINRYLDFLENAFIIRRLQPYFTNIAKRVIKTPKLYIRDSGLLHTLAGIGDVEALMGSLYVGNSWEGYVIQQIIAQITFDVYPFFYRTGDGSEIDMVLVRGGMPIFGIEIKFTNAPQLSKGNYIAAQDLGNIPILVITPSAEDFRLSDSITICNINTMSKYLKDKNMIE